MFQPYDSGLLGSYGGGDVNWWHDYLRAEIGRCNDFHRNTCDKLSEIIAEKHDKITALEEDLRAAEALAEAAASQLRAAVDAYEAAEAKVEKVRSKK